VSSWRDATTHRWEQANFWGCEGFLPEFSQTCPKKTPKNDLKRKVLHVILGAIFFTSKHIGRHFCSYFQGFCEGFQRFCPDFQGFCPDFHQIKTFGGALTLPLPTPVLQQKNVYFWVGCS